jgi:hypothetical protein
MNVTSQLYDQCWNWQSACNSCYWHNQMLTVPCRLVTFFVVVALFKQQNDYILSSVVDPKIPGPEYSAIVWELPANCSVDHTEETDAPHINSGRMVADTKSGRYNFRSVSPQKISEQLLWSDFLRYVLSTTVAYHGFSLKIFATFRADVLETRFPVWGIFQKGVQP